MIKRYISLLLILALLPTCLAVPVMADETDGPWINVLDYGMEFYENSNSFFINGYKTVRYDLPYSLSYNLVDIVIYCSQPWQELYFYDSSDVLYPEVFDLGNGYYRVIASFSSPNYSSISFGIVFSSSTFFEVLDFKASIIPFDKKPLSYYGRVYDYSYTPIKETYFSGEGSSPMTSVPISPNAGKQNFEGFVSRIYLSSWNAYDFISLDIALWSSSFSSLKVEMDGISVPYEVNTIESTDVLGASLYLLDILIDTRNLDRSSDSYILVDVSGMVNPTFTGNFTVRSCLGFVSAPSPSLWTYWFTNLQGWLSSGFSSVTSSLSSLGSSIAGYISDQTTSITNSFSSLQSHITGRFNDLRNWIASGHMTITLYIETWGQNISSTISSWGQSLKDSTDALPKKIAEELKALIVPADGAVESMATKSEALVSDRFGGVFEGAQIVDNWAGQLQTQAATQVFAIPVVNMNILGSNFPIGGWEVDLIPEGFEIIFESVKIIIDILATAAFVNGIKNRLERTLEG